MKSEQDLSPPSKGSLSSGGNSSCEPCWKGESRVWGRMEGALNLREGSRTLPGGGVNETEI